MTKRHYSALFVVAITAFGAWALVDGTMHVDARKIDWVALLAFAVVSGVAQRLPILLFRSSAISVAFAPTIATYVLYGIGASLWVNLVSAAVNSVTPRRKPIRKTLFNAAMLTICAYLAGSTYQLVGGEVPPGEVLPTVLAVAVSGLVYFVVNSTLTAAVISLTGDVGFVAVWRENYGWMFGNFIATAINGAAMALAYQALHLFGLATFLLPLVVAWYSFKLYVDKAREVRERDSEVEHLNAYLRDTVVRLERSNLSIIGALVGALEAKDKYTHGHSAATMLHAVELARRLNLNDEAVAQTQLAALFHDIGKIGVPESILRKPGPLDDNEWTEMKVHPDIGDQLLANVPSLDKVRPVVRAHHERYDGKGYPLGLKGDEIPMAAQVIGVADAFQAMTSTRSYRKAMSRSNAIAELERSKGTQFNPAVVDAFLAILHEEQTKKRAHVDHDDDHDHEHEHDHEPAVAYATVSVN